MHRRPGARKKARARDPGLSRIGAARRGRGRRAAPPRRPGLRQPASRTSRPRASRERSAARAPARQLHRGVGQAAALGDRLLHRGAGQVGLQVDRLLHGASPWSGRGEWQRPPQPRPGPRPPPACRCSARRRPKSGRTCTNASTLPWLNCTSFFRCPHGLLQPSLTFACVFSNPAAAWAMPSFRVVTVWSTLLLADAAAASLAAVTVSDPHLPLLTSTFFLEFLHRTAGRLEEHPAASSSAAPPVLLRCSTRRT